jgi:hypothetical protein
MNRDGQMHQLLSIEFPEFALNLHSIAYADGLPMTAKFICESILNKEAV